jgi:hypothetical protein
LPRGLIPKANSKIYKVRVAQIQTTRLLAEGFASAVDAAAPVVVVANPLCHCQFALIVSISSVAESFISIMVSLFHSLNLPCSFPSVVCRVSFPKTNFFYTSALNFGQHYVFPGMQFF